MDNKSVSFGKVFESHGINEYNDVQKSLIFS